MSKSLKLSCALLVFLTLLVSGCRNGNGLRYPILYLDMDGTTLDDSKKIRPATLAAIDEYRSCGGKVGFASGRSPEQMEPYVGSGGSLAGRIDLPLVLYNGAIIYDVKQRRVTHRSGLAAPAIRSVVTELEGVKAGTYGLLAQFPALPTLRDRTDPELDKFLEAAHIVAEPACDFLQCLVARVQQGELEMPAKLLLLARQGQLAAVQQSMSQALAGKVRFIIGDPVQGVIEVLDPETNKAAGISRAISPLENTLSQVAAFGDSQNDVEMVRDAGLGFAMRDSHEETRAVADEVIGDNDTDAIASKIRTAVMEGCDRQ